MRTAAPYTALGPNTVTCTTSTINGDVGTQAASISNTGCTINGLQNLNLGAQIVTDLNAAKSEVDGQTCTTTQSGTLAGITLGPGVHCFTAGAALTGLLTLNGPANGVWIFRIGTGGPADLAATDFTVQMSGGGQACNVFWRTSQDATVTRGGFLGTILSGRDVTVTGVGTYGGRVLATRDLTITNVVPMTFAGCAAPASITVSKDFIPNNPSPVSVALSCTSGTVVTTPLNASEGAPAVFSVGGALPGATCTATETVPAGYTANQANCVGVPLGGSCTITNTLAAGASTITVNKDFIPNSTATVPVSLTCTSGTVTATPLNASESTPAVFTVTGASAGATCTATETVPAGYTASQANCVNVALGGTCTITNTSIQAVGAAAIPTLSEWAMVLLAGLLAIAGFAAMRRKGR